jgi:DEAD/DEAH box helicase domain-containing protein
VSLDHFLNRIKSNPALAQPLSHHEVIPERLADYQSLTLPLGPEIERGLQRQRIERLFSHQAVAIDAIRAGKNVVAVTPTASGKSLTYNLPVLEQLSRDPTGHAIYLFPLKALEQDQAVKLEALLAASGLADKVSVGIYDGDTPHSARAKMRAQPPGILITNPDMLHLSIMGFHDLWEDLLRGLRFVVIDELHVYRGVFGSNIRHVLHRLLRLCRHYGAEPQVIGASATIAGAQQLAENLTGLPFVSVEESGAPASKRHFLFFNPAESYLTFALRLFIAALQADLKVIAFTKARRTTELLHRWLTETAPEMAGRVSSYRAGFLPEERREIEGRLQSGELSGVISTSALELGIDIGGLDVCILVGYPGTVSATWQRAGRVGRGRRPAAVCLVAGRDQLDQYFMKYPADFFARPVEAAVIDATNEHIVRQHLLCAAQEIPIARSDPDWGDVAYGRVIQELASVGKLLEGSSGDRWFSAQRRPQRHVNIRGTGDQFTIINDGDDRKTPLGSISGRAVFAECHPGAIYLHRAEQYRITDLDLQSKIVKARSADVAYYTQALFEKDTEILDRLDEKPLAAGWVTLARLKVTERLVGYQKRRIHTQELVSQHDLTYPPTSFETIGVAVAIPAEAAEMAGSRELHFRGGIHGMEHALLGLAPMFALCDRQDMGGYSLINHPQVGGPAVFLYDGHPGGIGLSARLYDVFTELAQRTLKLVSGCDCELGCPSCIQSPKCGHGNTPLDKAAAILTMEVITGAKTISASRSFGTAPIVSAKPVETVGEGQEVKPAATKPVALPNNWPPGRSVVIFDVETQRSADEVGGWNNIRAMGLAWAVACRLPENRWSDFSEADVAGLIEVLKSADLVVGFNLHRFDYEVLKGYTGFDFRKLPTYDILVEIVNSIGQRLSLNSVAAATLGATKSADGLQSLEWWRRGEVQKVAEYCRKDVEVTRDVFFYILKHGHLLFEKRGIGLVRAPMRAPFR